MICWHEQNLDTIWKQYIVRYVQYKTGHFILGTKKTQFFNFSRACVNALTNAT
jgi:hypothetical protein